MSDDLTFWEWILSIEILFVLAGFGIWLIHVKQGDYSSSSEKRNALIKELSKGIACGVLVYPAVFLLVFLFLSFAVLAIIDKILNLIGIKSNMANYLSSKTINRID